MTSTSTASLAERVAEVRRRIEAACERSGRSPGEVTLVAVSKTHPVEVVARAIETGLTAFGENRAQEFVPKAEAARERGLNPEWHFIGHLQRNKVRSVLPYVDVIHSLDSTRLVAEIARRAHEARPGHRRLRCFIEVNVAGEQQKQGVPPNGVRELLNAARGVDLLDVRGLMTVPPHVPDTESVRPVFRTLRELATQHGLTELSMGMTDDFEIAIEEGATLVRVGRAIFGERLT